MSDRKSNQRHHWLWRQGEMAMAGLLGMFGRLFGQKAAAEPVVADPAIAVFAAAGEIAASYGETAARNVASLAEGGYRAQILEAFETSRMLAALNVRSSDGYEHYLLHSFSDGSVDPVILRLLWDIHQSIVVLEAGVGPHLPQATALDLCQTVLVDSQFLAAEFAHAVRIASAGLGPRAYSVARDPALFNPKAEPGDRKLDKLIRQHHSAVKRLGDRLRREYPDSESVRDRVDTYIPIDTPFWLSAKDHDGAVVISDVWFPAEFAKPLLDHLAQAQAGGRGR